MKYQVTNKGFRDQYADLSITICKDFLKGEK